MSRIGLEAGVEEILFHGFQSRRGRILPYVRPPSTRFFDAAGGDLRQQMQTDRMLMYQWIDLCFTSMFIRLQRGLPVLVGRAPQGIRVRRDLPPCQEKGQGGAIPAVSMNVVNSNGQDD